ncbi:hypothetical protein [Nocardioides rubriscoriae]|uniref:hypothetical protein n=1 Tax=Nocardioides rubriscoriae TaxID=642762 RepID=UPI0011DF72B7|nr:hypothetical protein [Nocardioides rubriscoriae]
MWGGRQGAAALAVVVVMVVWRSVLMAGSYFNQDDYFFHHRAFEVPLSFDFLFLTPNAGHVNPMQQLTFWLVVNLDPFGWPLVATIVVVMQTLTVVVLWHVLTRLLPGRRVRVLLLAVLAWSPLSLMTSLWWAAAVCLWPHLFFSLLGVLFLTRQRQGVGRAWVNHAVVVGSVVMGLAWHERAILITPVLLATAVLLADEASGWRRVTAALRRFWPLWVGLVVLLVTYLVLHRQVTTVEGGDNDVGAWLDISWAFVGSNVLPGVFSGPWAATLKGGAVDTDGWVVAVSLVLAALTAGLLLWRGGPARRWAVAFFVAYVLADLALVLAGRSGFGRVIGLDPRYASDTIHAAVLAAAFALRGAPEHYGLHLSRPAWARRRTAVLGVLGGAYLVGAAFGTAVLVPHFQNLEDRAYVDHFRADLAADPQQVVVDALVPADIVLPLVGDDSRLSRVFAPLPEDPVFDEPSPRMRMVDRTGHLVPVRLAGSIPMRPGPVDRCGWPVDSTTTDVPLAVGIRGRLVAHLGYFTDTEAVVEVAAGSWSDRFLARTGPNEIWFVLPDEGREVESVSLRVDGASTVCVASLEVGLPELP